MKVECQRKKFNQQVEKGGKMVGFSRGDVPSMIDVDC